MSKKRMKSRWINEISLEPGIYVLTPSKREYYNLSLDWNFNGKVIYGPAISKRFGLSLGINLFPYKRTCLFNCIYCCANDYLDTIHTSNRVGTINVLTELRKKLNSVLSNENLITKLDSIGFCGNGDSLLSPYFDKAVEIVSEWVETVKEKFGKRIKTGVISNFFWSDSNIDALKELDEIYVKLDAVDDKLIHLINRPKNPSFRIDEYVEWIKAAAKILGDKLKISTAVVFYKKNINNYSHLKAEYSFTLRDIDIKDIYLHNINPPTPLPLKRATLSEMISLANVIRKNSKKNVFILWETYAQAIMKNKMSNHLKK